MDAVFDATGAYRYRLWRRWDAGKTVAFVMLNPSAASAYVNDPTIRRCVDFAQTWGYGSLTVVNLFAYRAAYPKALAACSDPIGPHNDAHLMRARDESDAIVLAWGVHGTLRGRDRCVLSFFDNRRTAFCLGVTKHGHPRHPGRLRKDTRLVPFTGGCRRESGHGDQERDRQP